MGTGWTDMISIKVATIMGHDFGGSFEMVSKEMSGNYRFKILTIRVDQMSPIGSNVYTQLHPSCLSSYSVRFEIVRGLGRHLESLCEDSS